jgi:hypothetical protein
MIQSPVQKVKIKVSKINIFPVVLYVYETRSLTLEEETRLRIFVKKFLKRISASIAVLLTSL